MKGIYMKFDLTFTITAVIAACALIAPVLTTLINNHYQVRLKQLELENRHQEDLINHKRDLFKALDIL